MNSKWCVDGSEWSENKKQTNMIHFERKRRDVAQASNYFKQTYLSNMTAVQTEKNLV